MGRFREWTRGNVETREPWTGGLSANSIADSLCLNFLVYLAEISSYFPMKTNKRKVWKRRFDLANGKYLSLFLEVFARMVKVTHFAQVINFPERAQVKIHLRKVDKITENIRFLCCFFFFNTTEKQSLLPLLQNNSKNKKFVAPSFLQPLFFKWALYPCACKGCRSDNKTSKTIRKRKTNILWKIVVFLKEVVFQFFIQKYCTWQNNTFWCGIISTKKTLAEGYAERSIK